MDLIVEDEYIEAMGTYLKKEGEDIEEKLNQYIAILRGISEEGIVQGKTSEALAEFADQAQLLRQMKTCGQTANHCCRNYITRVDKADRDLY